MDSSDPTLRHHLSVIYGTCRRVLGNDQDAADATQDVVMKWLQAKGSIHGSVAGWLHATARTTAVDLIRRREAQRRVETHMHRATTMTCSDNIDAEIPADLHVHLDAALSELPADERTLLIEYHLEGCGQIALAKRWNLSQAHVSRRLAKARDLLSAALHRRGVAIGGTALAALLVNEAQAASCPTALVEQIAPGIPAHVLASSVMGGGVLKIALTAMVATVLVGTTGMIIVNALTDSPQASSPPPIVAPALLPPIASMPTQPPLAHPSEVLWGGAAAGRWLGRAAADGVSSEPMGEGEPRQQISTVKTSQRPWVEWLKGRELHLDVELGAARTITVFMVLDDAQGNWGANLQHQVALPAGRSGDVVIRAAEMTTLDALAHDPSRQLRIREISIHTDAATLLLRSAAIVLSSPPAD